MVIPAGQAQSFTLTAIGNNTEETVRNELRRTDSAIQSATGQERFSIIYNAQLVGNPTGDPHDDTKVDDVQIIYRDVMIDSKYKVGWDEDTGYWTFSWDVVGPEELVTVYSLRNNDSLLPGTEASQIINQIGIYFETVSPPVTVKTSVVTINGGDIDEGDFGAPTSEFYEYVILAVQDDDVDHSTDIKNNLIVNLSTVVTDDITASTGPNRYTFATTNTGIFSVGEIIGVEGFTNSNNNGVSTITAVGSGYIEVNKTLISEPTVTNAIVRRRYNDGTIEVYRLVNRG